MAYNNYYNPYNVQQPNIDRINRQIEDLQNLKNQMQNPPQIPVQNFINSQPQANQEESWAVQLLASSIEIYKFMCYNISIASKFCME